MKKLAYLFIFSLFIINSCKKAEVDSDTQSAVDNGICEQEFTKITPSVNGKAISEKGVQKMFAAGCPETYVDPLDSINGFPVTMWMYYDTLPGGIGCTGDDGKIRKGAIEAVFTAPWSDSAVGLNLITLYFHNYSVNGISYDGSIVISKPTKHSFNTVITNGHCVKSGGWELWWNCNRTINWLAGYTTPEDPSDDVFEISGTANGINRDGKSYDVNIVSPLLKSNICPNISKGIMDITPEGKATRTFDYGDGTCDNKATVTINGNTYNLTLN